jgi:hypothetical protein
VEGITDARRGFLPTDERDFHADKLPHLKNAQKDILYLLERGYPIKNASTFVGNHFMLSERQRLAIVRATSTTDILSLRSRKQLSEKTIGKKVVIDGLNLIITLEVALSDGILIRCMDQTIRDLAGLRGTYRLIEQTDTAIRMIGEQLKLLGINEAVFYLDSPVSNTGRLRMRILELLSGHPFRVEVELISHVDSLLEQSENVITSDAIILNKCGSWYNLGAQLINQRLLLKGIIDLS